jgi:hypothetical protein
MYKSRAEMRAVKQYCTPQLVHTPCDALNVPLSFDTCKLPTSIYSYPTTLPCHLSSSAHANRECSQPNVQVLPITACSLPQNTGIHPQTALVSTTTSCLPSTTSSCSSSSNGVLLYVNTNQMECAHAPYCCTTHRLQAHWCKFCISRYMFPEIHWQCVT